MSGTVFTAAEFEIAVVDLSAGTTAVTAKNAIIRGVYVNTLPSGDVELQSGGARKFKVPGSSDVGSWLPMGDSKMWAGISVVPGGGASGELVIVYKENP